MNKMRLTVLLAGALALIPLSSPVSSAKDKDEKENDRLQNAGTVLKEIMDVPDDIPQDLIDKARCVIVFPSVVKAAFVVGGSYGRGAMVCRPAATSPAHGAHRP
jgi:lipid-binding SYLF domain-containing protein